MAKHEMGVRPLHDRILVRRTAEEEKTAGGLFIPDTALPLEVKIGDKVLFSKYAGTELKLNGEEFLMMREEDILGIYN
jgi:chaperonin GroES